MPRKPPTTVKAARDRQRALGKAAAAKRLAQPQLRKGGPPARRQVTAVLRKAQLRYEVFELKVKGLTFRQIAERLSINPSYARQLCWEVAGEYDAGAAELAPAIRTLVGERLHEVHRAMTPLLHGQVPGTVKTQGTGKAAKTVVIPPDPLEVARLQTVAAGRVVQANGRLAELYGADAPQKLALTNPAGTGRYHELSEDELERQVAEKAALLGEVVDAG